MSGSLRLRQLEALKAVAQHGSMTRAAGDLGVSQPAVSRLIADLSTELGFTLLDRRDGRLVPTQEARYILPDIRRVVDLMAHISETSRGLNERKAGHLRVACLPGFATSHLPGVVSKFLHARPDVTITVEPDRPERILEWIIGEQYDCGITDSFEGHPAIESETIAVRSVCVFPKDHRFAALDRVTAQDLHGERLIHARRDSPFYRRLLETFTQAAAVPRPVIEVRQFTAACEFVALGEGISVVSELDALTYAGRVAYRPYEPAVPHRLSLVRPIHKTPSLITLEFMESLFDSLRPLAA
ncbi:transcriptional regulator, LysR family [Jannaschia faecimaris]|uniref:Transcriptional regulator, LysR family n=1 Tax=Jannaschia faecimaris TaxID=1244108 RepID=A0A1H3T6T5_9RHOB|nr:LysR substrate-binding domain-containing protein [Jannaschia faecimaris]SDZ45770.1 transcriptional regulator, LysR family [Jannaschia faecimaris]